MCTVWNETSSCYHQVETTIECKRQKKIIFELSENQLSEIFTISFTKDYVVIIKLEALRQCVPPPRHVLPVLPSDKSVWMNVWMSVNHFPYLPIVMTLENNPYHHQNLTICSLAHCNLPWKFHANLFGSFCAKLLTDRQTNKQWRLHILLGGGNYSNC